MLGADPDLIAARSGQTLIADKRYYGREFEHDLAHAGAHRRTAAAVGTAAAASRLTGGSVDA